MEMGGWDVIYASNVTKLNAVLAASMQKLLTTFSYSDANTGISFSGTFAPWSIRPGGTANRINVQVPIKEGTLNGGGFSNLSLDDLEPVLNVALTLVQGTSIPATQDVAFDIKDASTDPSSAKDGDVYIANVDESGNLSKRDPSGIAAEILKDNLPKCFVQNSDKIAYVFASVFTTPQDQPWLKPKATRITYFGSQDGSLQAMAIKTLTQSPWGTDGLQTAVDPSLLQGGGTMFYALSKGVFLQNVLLPCIPKAIGHGVSASSFKFNGPSHPADQDTCSITNTHSFDLPSVENAGTHYYPKVTHYKVVINNSQVITTASGSFDITGLAGASVDFNNLQVINQLYYDHANKRVAFKLVSHTEPSVDKHIPWEYYLLALGGLIGLIIRGIIEIVVDVVDNTVQDAIKGQGSLDVVSIPTSTAVWTGLESFDISEASLEQAFILRG